MTDQLGGPLTVKPQAIIFDWDNTLVDSWPVIHDALNTTFRAYDKPEWTLADTKVRVRHSMRDSFPPIFGDVWEEAGEVFYARYAEIHATDVAAADGAAELLATIHELEIYQSVVSNKTGSFLRAEAENLGWTPYFSKLVGALDAPRDKPDPAPVLMSLEPGALLPGPHVWFIGDADIDMTCGANAGCHSILIRPEAPTDGEFPDHPPVMHFSSCHYLCNFLRTL